MPRQTPYPTNDVYRWEQGQGIVGVVGVAPMATLDFYWRLTVWATVKKDWEHVRISDAPSRRVAVLGSRYTLDSPGLMFLRTLLGEASAART